MMVSKGIIKMADWLYEFSINSYGLLSQSAFIPKAVSESLFNLITMVHTLEEYGIEPCSKVMFEE